MGEKEWKHFLECSPYDITIPRTTVSSHEGPTMSCQSRVRCEVTVHKVSLNSFHRKDLVDTYTFYIPYNIGSSYIIWERNIGCSTLYIIRVKKSGNTYSCSRCSTTVAMNCVELRSICLSVYCLVSSTSLV